MLQNSRGVFFLRSRSAAGSCDTAAKGLGGPENVKNDKIHKIHAPKIQGRVFSEGAEAPQAAATQTHRAGRPWNRQERWISSNIWPRCSYFSKNVDFSKCQNWNLEMCLGTVSACPNIQIWENIANPKIHVLGPHSYQLGWAIYDLDKRCPGQCT